MKENRVGVKVAGGGEANKETFVKDLKKESRKNRRVGASFRMGAGIMEDGKLWLQVIPV